MGGIGYGGIKARAAINHRPSALGLQPSTLYPQSWLLVQSPTILSMHPSHAARYLAGKPWTAVLSFEAPLLQAYGTVARASPACTMHIVGWWSIVDGGREEDGGTLSTMGGEGT
ncbi:uncharacterized protein SPSK_02845 [Sporothrix schenckii 1099-18]|uniref:Uncharacterized protein n=1 Tax=Sporothrix schenckii 1099-18 TaxID=1397361 RepID=A0A0F2MD59_SPOSC|nr:uncharacterized protein SPSK_02845 [Sporothrix schenckii 1099-18]KJR86790.1 hypothetical protein SPSK_02845 [Sporothrix schenckii 1099-18]